MKSNIGLLICAACLCGCASRVVKTGDGTYMIARGGTVMTTESELKMKCFKEANKFCEKKGLEMVPISMSGHDGKAFVVGSSFELNFRAVPSTNHVSVPN